MSTAMDLGSAGAVGSAVGESASEVIPGIDIPSEMDVAIRHVRAVDGIMGLLEGISLQECRAILFEVQVRRELETGTGARARVETRPTRASVPKAKAPKVMKTHLTLEQALKQILADAPRGGFSSREIVDRGRKMGLQAASVAAQLSSLGTKDEEVSRTGERGAYRYTMA